MSEALIVHRAFNISLVVGGIAFLGAIVFIAAFMLFEERKYRRSDEGKHTKTQDNLPIISLQDDLPVSTLDQDHISQSSETTGKHRIPVVEFPDYTSTFDPTVTSPDLDRLMQDIAINGKHHAPKTEVPDTPTYSVADTVVDMGIPREALQYNGPTTRLDFLKATDDDTDYFDKIKDMVDGIQ